MAKVIEIPYKPRESFIPFHETKKRFRTVRAHRRFGKTVGFVNDSIKGALTDVEILAKERGLKYDAAKLKEWREMPRQFAYIAPYHKQAKTIAWESLKYYSSPIPGIRVNESELRIDFPGNGRVRLFGADNINALRGLKNWDIKMDEFSDFDPSLWKEAISPTGIDTLAPITFGGTTKGADHFYDLCEANKNDPDWFNLFLPASLTGVLTQEQLDQEKKLNGELAFLREYELLATAIEGAIFGPEMRWLEENGRIRDIILEEHVPIETYWDLGWNDYTIVVFVQRIFQNVHIIDCAAFFQESMLEIAKKLQKMDYRYGTHHLPHDANNGEQTSGMSRKDVLQQVFSDVIVHSRPKIKEDALDAFRTSYKRFLFNNATEGSKTLWKALRSYRREFNEETRVWGSVPKHSWESHYADALLLCAQDMRQGVMGAMPPPAFDWIGSGSSLDQRGGIRR